jgi:hypothetical protein
MKRHPHPRRRLLLGALAATAAAFAGGAARAAPRPKVQVWKSPTCGCCKDWIAVMQKAGFDFEVFDTGNNAARARLGLDVRYGSCHTALVEGYVVEGHVPPADVQRLLRERPAALGLAAPGMPVGSPGMDGPAYGGRRDPYDVLLVARDGSARVYASYR